MTSLFLLLWLGLAMVLVGVITEARAQSPAPPPIDGPLHSVVYVEVMPTSRADGVAALRSYRDATRSADGNLRCELVSRIGQPHIPGYPLYVLLGRAVNAWAGDAQRALVTISAISSGLAVAAAFVLGAIVGYSFGALIGMREAKAVETLTAPLRMFRRGEPLALMPNVFLR